MLEPGRGLEPLTYRLQVGCAANCATRAGRRGQRPFEFQHKNDPPERINTKYEAGVFLWQAITTRDPVRWLAEALRHLRSPSL